MTHQRLVAQFTKLFTETAHKASVALHRTRLKDFLDHDYPDTDCPYEFAGKALCYFCIEDGKYNRFQVGITTTILFLQNVTGSRPTEKHVKALKECIDRDPTETNFIEWARGAFPQRMNR